MTLANDSADSFEITEVLENSRSIKIQRGGLLINKPSENPELEKIKSRFKPIHEEFMENHWINYYFILIELSRQILISFIILLDDDKPVNVSLSIMLINGLFIILIIWMKPFKSFQTFILTLLTEFFLFIICLGTLGLAFLQDYVDKRGLTHELDVYLNIGWMIVYAHIILIYFFLVIQFISYCIMFFNIVKEIIPVVRNFFSDKGKVL